MSELGEGLTHAINQFPESSGFAITTTGFLDKQCNNHMGSVDLGPMWAKENETASTLSASPHSTPPQKYLGARQLNCRRINLVAILVSSIRGLHLRWEYSSPRTPGEVDLDVLARLGSNIPCRLDDGQVRSTLVAGWSRIKRIPGAGPVWCAHSTE